MSFRSDKDVKNPNGASSSSSNSSSASGQTGLFATQPSLSLDSLMTRPVEDELSSTIQTVCLDFFTSLERAEGIADVKESDSLKQQIALYIKYDNDKKAISISIGVRTFEYLEKMLANDALMLPLAVVAAIQLATAFRMQGNVDAGSLIIDSVATQIATCSQLLKLCALSDPKPSYSFFVKPALDSLSSFIKNQLKKYAKNLVAVFPTDQIFVALAGQNKVASVQQKTVVHNTKK